MLVAELNNDIKKDVMEAVTSRMTAICTCTDGRNFEPSWPLVVKATPHLLLLSYAWEICSLYFFVHNVDQCSPNLAAMFPVLSRGLNDKVKKSNEFAV